MRSVRFKMTEHFFESVKYDIPIEDSGFCFKCTKCGILVINYIGTAPNSSDLEKSNIETNCDYYLVSSIVDE